jgi:N-acetyl-anhydromuramyl-L-alanine amidase AmpD
MGMKDIGYHYGIEYVNRKVKVFKGRSMEVDGAHTKGKNKDYIGICLVGNYDITEPTDDMYNSLAMLCRDLMDTNGFDMDNIHGHFNFADKTCPGKNFNWMKLAIKILEV